jgi:hypothetical protein
MRRIKTAAILLAIVLGVLGCSDPASKQSNKDVSVKVADSGASAIEDFESFFEKFNKDSIFQVARIEFPLQFKSNEEEESIIRKIEWSYTKLIEEKGTKTVIRKKLVSNTEVRIDYMEEDTGVLISHTFLQKGGRWMLVNIEDHST